MLNGLNGDEWCEWCEWPAIFPFFWIKKPRGWGWVAGLTEIKANSASQQSWSWSWGLAELGNFKDFNKPTLKLTKGSL